MKLLAIDPGTNESAYVVCDMTKFVTNGKSLLSVDPKTNDIARLVCDLAKIVVHGKIPNDTMLREIKGNMHSADHLVIERMANMGMAVGAEVLETVFWSGRFVQAFPRSWSRLTRHQIKMHLCGSMRAKDPNIRQALIDKFGGPESIGRKRSPGPLFGISGDVWSALAVAITWLETPASQTETSAPPRPCRVCARTRLPVPDASADAPGRPVHACAGPP